MADKGWTARVATAAGVAAGTGAAQLGLGYGLGVIVWPVTVTQDRSEWLGSLGWATWITASATVFGAVIASRLSGGQAMRSRGPWRLAFALSAGFGALVAVALIALPARSAVRLDAHSPQTIAASYALVGVALGVLVAYWAVRSRPVAANLIATAAWLWALAITAIIVELSVDRDSATYLTSWQFAEATSGVRYGVIYWPSALLTLTAAFVIGVISVIPAVRRGDLGLGAATSGAVGPLLVAASFLALSPRLTDSLGPIESAYLIAPYAVLAGLAGSAVTVAAGKALIRRKTGDQTGTGDPTALVDREADPNIAADQTGSSAPAIGKTGSSAPAIGKTGSSAPAIGKTGSSATTTTAAADQTGNPAAAIGKTGSSATTAAADQTGNPAAAIGKTGSSATTTAAAVDQTGNPAPAIGKTGSLATAVYRTGDPGATAQDADREPLVADAGLGAGADHEDRPRRGRLSWLRRSRNAKAVALPDAEADPVDQPDSLADTANRSESTAAARGRTESKATPQGRTEPRSAAQSRTESTPTAQGRTEASARSTSAGTSAPAQGSNPQKSPGANPTGRAKLPAQPKPADPQAGPASPQAAPAPAPRSVGAPKPSPAAGSPATRTPNPMTDPPKAPEPITTPPKAPTPVTGRPGAQPVPEDPDIADPEIAAAARPGRLRGRKATPAPKAAEPPAPKSTVTPPPTTPTVAQINPKRPATD
jgi:hypothetical protein